MPLLLFIGHNYLIFQLIGIYIVSFGYIKSGLEILLSSANSFICWAISSYVAFGNLSETTFHRISLPFTT